MNQEEFVRRYESDWQTVTDLLDAMEGRGGKRVKNPKGIGNFPFLYRRVCQQLALARDRDYAAHLIDRLNSLVLRGHQHLYEARAGTWSGFVQAVAVKFPNQIRSQALIFWVATALMFLPALGLAFAITQAPDLVYTVLEPTQVDTFEEWYRPDTQALGRDRGDDTDFSMFGFYIRNNIGVGFRTFAGGLLFGIGSAFFLVFNGVYFGAVAGHLINAGFAETFFAFVIGHGAFELTAIVLAGMAGLKLGLALIAPGRLPRLRALRECARDSIEIVYAVVFMLVIAAFLEAFWSSSSAVSPQIKFAVGTALWLFVAVYLMFAGRGRGPQ
jgi:uncharacterized membrane protein SpoIIM required for sporulation